MPQPIEPPSRLMRFYSREEVVKFMKSLLEVYQKAAESYGDKLGALVRAGTQDAAAAKLDPKGKTVSSKGWVKMGTLLVNVTDPSRASTEVIYQIHDDLRQKVASATAALSSFEQGASSVIPQNMVYLVYLRNGTPERIIAQNPESKRETFSFSANYKVI